MKQSVTTLLAAISLLSVIGAGCGKKDPTLEAAPPPGPNAVPEAGGGQPKQMPGNPGPTPGPGSGPAVAPPGVK